MLSRETFPLTLGFKRPTDFYTFGNEHSVGGGDFDLIRNRQAKSPMVRKFRPNDTNLSSIFSKTDDGSTAAQI